MASVFIWSFSAAAAAQPPAANPLKQALREGRPLIGTTLTVPNLEVAAALAATDFDFLWIEMEHGPITLETARQMILATRGLKAVPITRVPVNQPWLAKRVLDIGSFGVVFPFSSTRQLVEQAVASCKYPPAGIRGYSPGLAAARWGMSASDYVKAANDNILVVPIIEEKQAVENIDEIAAVPGIDVLFIGANDLSFSYGVGGELDHPLVVAAVEHVLAAAKRNRVPVGYPSGAPAEIQKWIERGIRFFQAGNDLGLMRQSAAEMFRQLLKPDGKGGLKIPY
jgi:2-keto-3-deoxy-L-rhamnonate aldolase RhmA